jgi:hypothetical protein
MQQSTILIRQVTRDRLKKVARKDQTYDDLINQLIDLKISIQGSPHRRVDSLQSSELETIRGNVQ